MNLMDLIAQVISGEQGANSPTRGERETRASKGSSPQSPLSPLSRTDMHNAGPADRWLLYFTDHDSVEVTFAPPASHAEALVHSPGAIAAEPLPEVAHGPVPAGLMALFDACVQASLYGYEDRVALLAMLALDPEGTRGLIEAMHSRTGRCRRCRHFRRPGLSDGYCTGRDDLPHVYGFMHEPPGDGGARCNTFDEGDGGIPKAR